KLVYRCLQKDQRQRLQAIGEARITIEETISGTGVSPVEVHGQDAHATRATTSLRGILPWAVASGLLLVLGIATGWWAGTRRGASTPNWSAQMLGGPSVAMGPRISPDGHTLAFQAMVDDLTQVAVMDTDSGDWTVLTKDRTRGYVTELNWSNDGSRIYYDREFSVPGGIYTVSRFGGDERLVLDDAIGPEVLPDGSLLVVRLNKERDLQLYRFWPESGRLEALDAFLVSGDLCPPVRAFRDGKDAVFFGRTKEQDSSDPASHLYILNLASGKTRRLAPNLEIRQSSGVSLFALAVSSDDQFVLIDLNVGDLHRITSIPRNGPGPSQTLLTLTSRVWFMDVGKDGDLYIDQVHRPMEALRFATSGGTGESLAATENPGREPAIQLPDGRMVLGSMVAGRSRLLVTKPGGEAALFIQTNEETSPPLCLVGRDKVAFRLGSPGHSVIALASITDGRIVQRLSGIAPGDMNDLSAAPDGKTLYYSDSRTVWAVPVAGSQPRRVGPGYSVAPDPNGRDLIVLAIGKEGVKLFKVPVAGGVEQPILVQGPVRVAPTQLNPNAVAKDGRVVLSSTSPDKWFYGVSILDPRSGKLTEIPVDFTGDLISPAWLPDGRVLSSASPLKLTLWRFRPVGDGTQ
ncbi:MAG TPA: hypothetical protein VNM47_17165, partial [Terriglobia bacterium]|nr:hypothetical protein [Terriglobia bacterium]